MLDIKTYKNYLDGRQGWAYTCNSEEITVIVADMDKPQNSTEYKTFGTVNVAIEDSLRKGHRLTVDGTLEKEGEEWSIGGWGCCIKSSFTYEDQQELINRATAPTVSQNDVVAIISNSKEFKTAMIHLYKVGKININCQTMAKLIPLTDLEMKEIKKNITRWATR